MCSWDKSCLRFLNTLKITNPSLQCILIADCLSELQANELQNEFNVQIIRYPLGDNFWSIEPLGINRWHILEPLFINEPDTIFIMSDVKDVIVQGQIDNIELKDNEIIVQEEQKTFAQCKCNREWMNRDKGNQWVNNKIISAGCLVGNGRSLQIIANSIKNRTYGAFSDQGEYNHFIIEHPEWHWINGYKLWTACQDCFSHVDSFGQCINNYGMNTPIMHFCGLSKMYKLSHIYGDDKLGEMYDKLRRYMSTIK